MKEFISTYLLLGWFISAIIFSIIQDDERNEVLIRFSIGMIMILLFNQFLIK